MNVRFTLKFVVILVRKIFYLVSHDLPPLKGMRKREKQRHLQCFPRNTSIRRFASGYVAKKW